MSFCELEKQKYIYKILLFGNSDVGKSTFAIRATKNEFKKDPPKTIGVNFHMKKVFVDNIQIELQIWDFSGEPKFEFLFGLYSKGIKAGIFMYDISKQKSMLSLTKWINLLRKYTKEEFPIFIVGTKSDLVEFHEQNENKLVDSCFICSSKTGKNIDNIFQIITEKIYYSGKKEVES